MKFSRSLRAIALSVALVVATGSCAAVVSTLPKVISIVSDAALIVDQIDSFASAIFKVKPDADLEKKVSEAIILARKALAFANRTAAGAENLSQAQLVAAFDDFRIAYQDLLALVGPLGVTTGGGAGASGSDAGTLGVARLQVPEPLALRL